MLKWIIGAIIAVVIAASVISWEAERCEAARQKYQSATATHPLSNPVASVPVSPDGETKQEQAQNQTGGACTDTNGYLCLILTPANLPNIFIVLIGLGGIVVAVGTLRIMEEQTEATRDAAKASANSVEAANRSLEFQETLNQQWVQVNGWRRHGGGSREQDPPRFRIAVDTSNPTNAPLTVIGATITAKGQTRTFIAGTTLGPNETPIIIETEEIVLSSPEKAVYMAYRLPVVVTGEVVYRDMFGKDRVQTFGQLCILGPDNYFQNMPFYQMRMPETEGTKSPENTDKNPN